MDYVHRQVVIRGEQARGGRVEARGAGLVLHYLPEHLQRSASMRLRGRSVVEGRRPAWLERVADLRLVDVDGSGREETVLHFEAPTLGTAAEDIYRQADLWEVRPEPGWTSFETYADVLRDVAAEEADSALFDRALLRAFREFQRPLTRYFDEIAIEDRRGEAVAQVPLTLATVQSASRLVEHVPRPRAVRVVGLLDMLRASTQSFALRLDGGEQVHGVLVAGDIAEATPLFKKRVLVVGRAVYRPSGRLLRIDAEAMEEGEGQPSLWSKVPAPLSRPAGGAQYRQPQSPGSGAGAFFGRIRAEESEEEFMRVLQELS